MTIAFKKSNLFVIGIFSLLTSSALTTRSSYFSVLQNENTQSVIDSLQFDPNITEGWNTMQTYLNNENDSVEFELVLTRNIPEGNDWYQSSRIGNIATDFIPSEQVSIDYYDPMRVWTITVMTTGESYIQLKSGTLPEGNPCVIPFKIKFKK